MLSNKMKSYPADAVPVSLVLLDEGKNLTFSGFLILSEKNGTEVKPTKMPYDAKGAGLFTVVVIAVYCISIVLFIASFIKRKKGITVEADENNTVTQYLTQVPDLKEKTAREHFKKLKMGIIEKVEKGVENEKDIHEGNRFGRFKEKRAKGSGEIRQPLLENECTNCVGTKPENSLDTCSKLVEALHSIKEMDEDIDYSKSSSESCPPSAGTSRINADWDSPLTPEKYYKFSSFCRQSSEESKSCVPLGQGTNWDRFWCNNSQKNNTNYGGHKSHLEDRICDISEDSLLSLPPPPPFQQGYSRDNFQHDFCQNIYPVNATSDKFFSANTNNNFLPNPGEATTVLCDQSGELDLQGLDTSEVTMPLPVCKTFRGKNWPPSPSLGQAARARLAPRSRKYKNDDWEDSAVGTNGFSLKVLDSECHRSRSPLGTPSAPKETRITLGSKVTAKKSSVSIL